MAGDRADFFVSHAGTDRAWAEWVAWQLMDDGYAVELDVWDWAAGRNFVTAMSEALDRCDRMVALFSTAYFNQSRYTGQEWVSPLVQLPGAGEQRLAPVRIENMPANQVPALLWSLVALDLFGLTEEQARRLLLEAVARPCRPNREPVFPSHGISGRLSSLGQPRAQMPGEYAAGGKLPTRNPGFPGPGRRA